MARTEGVWPYCCIDKGNVLAKITCLLSAVLILSACSKSEDIPVYRVAKSASESPAPAAPASPMGQATPEMTRAAVAAGGDLAWDAPKGWRSEPASGMRRASFKTPAGAEVSVIALPGDAGGTLANINRWRGQLGLKPLSESELGSTVRRVRSAAGEVLLVDLAAEGRGAKSRMLAAMLSVDGSAWFFKMTGPEAAVSAGMAPFEAFLGSLRRGS